MMNFFTGFGTMQWLGMGVMVLFWGMLVALVIWAVLALFPRERRSPSDTARKLLDQRYAAGEISESEYQQALRTLGGSA